MIKKKTLACGLLALWLWPSVGHCVFGIADLVHDPIHTVQSALTAIRSEISNVHEIRMIGHQLKQLANDAQQLANLPLTVVAEIQGAMTTYNSLLNQGRALVYNANGAVAAFDELFTNGKIPITERALRLLAEVRNTSRLGMQVQSIYDELCASTARVEQLANASQAAIGGLQAQQAGNQLLAEMAAQQNGIRLMQANTDRIATLMHMKGVMEDEAAREHALQMMQDWPTTLGGVTGFKLP